MALKQIDPVRWVLERDFKIGMKVTGLIYGDSYIIQNLEKEGALTQIANVACLPGILKHSFAMPDVHWGYGFPIGGVAAFSLNEGIISPGGVGYDISCGVRVMLTFIEEKEVASCIDELTAALFSRVPSGVGSKGALKISETELLSVLAKGALWAVKKGYGRSEDLECIEERGTLPHANPDAVSKKAIERGKPQLGTLGSGNHFLEIQVIDEIYDENVARQFGLNPGQVTVMIHCGSRGLGHQVCDDYIKVMLRAMNKYGISVPDRQLCCAPLKSEEAKQYLGAMQAAANYALANREIIGQLVREVFGDFFPKSDLKLLYDVSHNMAHIEKHGVEGKQVDVCVHRKGATRAFPPGHPSLPERYIQVGQPVIIPGSMGTESYILVGTKRGMEECFASTCHGAGRVLSRKAAMKSEKADTILKRLEDRGIKVMAETIGTVREEIPEAYKDVSRVVDVVEKAGISRKVARLRPLAVIKG
ncbi:tRNA-splicing ligase RtcB [Acetomicrobium thermoterrenum DSM 13490]|uniref:tRNA-splicing ligase RtcB n=1 Tax=Acetomicrobium thermoterrenum DSM 13490 TaxID=1120987 RepID=A0A1H3E3M2_9BACT|nr:RtcB family protein [Acetomicrobium thermoterrenum]SDX73271.1 tRNA-splicing ligase RtcB [Acetomicrobium thermoterrenum DSM 13490]